MTFEGGTSVIDDLLREHCCRRVTKTSLRPEKSRVSVLHEHLKGSHAAWIMSVPSYLITEQATGENAYFAFIQFIQLWPFDFWEHYTAAACAPPRHDQRSWFQWRDEASEHGWYQWQRVRTYVTRQNIRTHKKCDVTDRHFSLVGTFWSWSHKTSTLRWSTHTSSIHGSIASS